MQLRIHVTGITNKHDAWKAVVQELELKRGKDWDDYEFTTHEDGSLMTWIFHVGGSSTSRDERVEKDLPFKGNLFEESKEAFLVELIRKSKNAENKQDMLQAISDAIEKASWDNTAPLAFIVQSAFEAWDDHE